MRRFAHFHRFEVVVVLVLTVLVWGYEQSLDMDAQLDFDFRFGAVPSQMVPTWHAFGQGGLGHDLVVGVMPLVTANFLHASFAHVAMNMLFFWVFANALSEAAGRAMFLVVYLLGGIVAVAVYVHTNPASEVPMVGASGAIAALEGAYFAFAYRWELPHAHVWPLDGPVEPWRLVVIALFNFFLDSSAFFGHAQSTTAYGAHVGGFVGGALIAMVVSTVRRPEWRRDG